MKSKAYPNLFKRFQLNLHKKYVDSESKLHDLKYLFWECTLRCNLNCIHCGSDCHKESGVEDMPVKDFLRITKEISNIYNPNKITVILTGGEPLLRKDLETCGLELNKQGYPWGIVSNGLLLNKKRIRELIASGMATITVSLDGLEDEHNWFRGNKFSYAKVIEAIETIAAYQNKIAFDVVTCINQKNLSQLEEIKNLLIKIGVARWRIFTIFPIGRAANNKLLHLSPNQFKDLMEFIRKTRKEGGIAIKYGCEAFLGTYENEVRDGFYFCRAGINIASVLADGSISACPNINHAYAQGNIYEDKFVDVWQNKYVEYRKKLEHLPDKCMKCEVKKWCMGSSMHLRDKDNNLLRCHYEMLK